MEIFWAGIGLGLIIGFVVLAWIAGAVILAAFGLAPAALFYRIFGNKQ